MTDILASILRGLSNLARFSGRDTPRLFWPYAFFVVGSVFAMIAAFMLPIMSTTFARMQQFALDHPDQATVTSTPGSYSIQIEGHHPELMPDMTLMFTVLGVGIVVAVALLAASVVRRLHDRGRCGFWGLAPLPFLGVALAVFPKLFDELSKNDVKPETMSLFFALFFNNALYLASLALLVVLLIKESDAGVNRFGSPES